MYFSTAWNSEVKYQDVGNPSTFYVEKSNKILGGDDATGQGKGGGDMVMVMVS